MLANSDSFSLKIEVKKNFQGIHDKSIEFLEKNRRGPIKKVIDEKNHIEVKHSVKSALIYGRYRTTSNPMVIIYYIFRFTENNILINSRIHYTPSSRPPAIVRIKPSNINWVLKDRDFIRKYVQWIGLENDDISREIYPKSLLDEYNDRLIEGIKYFILMIHGLVSILTLIGGHPLYDLLYANFVFLVFMDPIVWFSYWIQGRQYRMIKIKYWSNESENM